MNCQQFKILRQSLQTKVSIFCLAFMSHTFIFRLAGSGPIVLPKLFGFILDYTLCLEPRISPATEAQLLY